MPDPVIEVVDVVERSRFEVLVDGTSAGLADYRDAERAGAVVRTFFHTEVDPAFEGRGLGGALVRAALDDARARGLRVVPTCPFVAAYIRRHPDDADLVDG